MTTSRLALLRPAGAASLALAAAVALGACSGADATPVPTPAVTATPTPTLTPAPTPTPSPSPAPTPRFTNEPDPELAALIPTEAAGVVVVVAPFDEFALTPGDVALAFGEIGNRFASLVVAYVDEPRTTLYAMRVDGPEVATEDLEPHLATAGRYVGIAGLDPEPWEAATVGRQARLGPPRGQRHRGRDPHLHLVERRHRLPAHRRRRRGQPRDHRRAPRRGGADPDPASPSPSAEPSASAEG